MCSLKQSTANQRLQRCIVSPLFLSIMFLFHLRNLNKWREDKNVHCFTFQCVHHGILEKMHFLHKYQTTSWGSSRSWCLYVVLWRDCGLWKKKMNRSLKKAQCLLQIQNCKSLTLSVECLTFMRPAKKDKKQW